MKSLSAGILRQFGRPLHDLAVLQGRWQALVGEPMAAHVEPAHYEAGRLTVAADGPAWASRVRQQEAVLVRALRADPEFKALREIRIQLQPTKPVVAPAVVPTRRPSRISPKAGRLIRGVAETVADPQLRAALERLGNGGNDDK